MNKCIEAVKYIIDVWDEVTGKTWRDGPDHVQQKFLEAEEELKKHDKDIIECGGCGDRRHISYCIDQWCLIDGVSYCYNCQIVRKIGWFEEEK